MRHLLLLICAAGLIGTAWHAVAVKAPEIERDIAARAGAAVAPMAVHPVTVSAAGRAVHLGGTAEDARERAALAAAASVFGAAEVVDGLTVLPRAVPFTFEAEKQVQSFRASGHVPSAEVRDALMLAVRSAAAGRETTADLTLAAGAPEGDWAGMAAAGLTALADLMNGSFALEGTAASLTGVAVDSESKARAEARAAEAPLGEWRVEVAVYRPLVSPYTMRLTKSGEAATYAGHAPDAETAASLEAAIAKHLQGAAGEVALARGMPEGDWPALVGAGAKALAALQSGTLEVRDREVRLTGTIGTDPELSELRPLLGEAWAVEIEVLTPDPDPELRLTVSNGAKIAFSGRVPRGYRMKSFAKMFPEAEIDPGLTATARGDPEAWEEAIGILNIVLPRMGWAVITMAPGKVEVSGRLGPGFSIKESRAALRSALGPDWELVFEVEEAPPYAVLTFEKVETGLSVGGILPEGLSATAAFDTLAAGSEIAVADAGLTGGGAAGGNNWAGALAALGKLLRTYENATGSLGPDSLTVAGTLAAGQSLEDLTAWAEAALGDTWTVALSGEDGGPVAEGGSRYNPATGGPERLVRGFWLPVFTFEPTPKDCHEQAAGAFADGNVTFVTGSARIDAKAMDLLNRLAGVARHCLNTTALTLEIGGHTDSVGHDDNNLALSEARAMAVLLALLERGVKADAMTAKGYGETRPIADNDTQAGRAQNRRISFDWSVPDDGAGE